MHINRNEYFRQFSEKTDKGLEIGPSHNPVFPKSDGWNIKIIDYLSKDGLIKKYSDKPNIDIQRIEPVDYIVEGSAFYTPIPEEENGTFKYIALSHALEHLCDVIDFFKGCEKLLCEGGKVIVAIPDKRFCFDFFRPLTTTGDILRSHWEGRSTHPTDILFDSNDLVCSNNGLNEWFLEQKKPYFEFLYKNDRSNFLKRANYIRGLGNEAPYIDMHRWVFTPSSFLFLMRDLLSIDQLRFKVLSIEKGKGPNIFACLEKCSTPHPFPAEERMAVQTAIALELQVQAVFFGQSRNCEESSGDDICRALIDSARKELSYLKARKKDL